MFVVYLAACRWSWCAQVFPISTHLFFSVPLSRFRVVPCHVTFDIIISLLFVFSDFHAPTFLRSPSRFAGSQTREVKLGSDVFFRYLGSERTLSHSSSPSLVRTWMGSVKRCAVSGFRYAAAAPSLGGSRSLRPRLYDPLNSRVTSYNDSIAI